LVVAPEEQGVAPVEFGVAVGPVELVVKREAGGGAQLTQDVATPLAEALHVPLHVEK
jgi:hypothetical protein